MRSEIITEFTKIFNDFCKVKPWNQLESYSYYGRKEGLFSGLETEAVSPTVRSVNFYLPALHAITEAGSSSRGPGHSYESHCQAESMT